MQMLVALKAKPSTTPTEGRKGFEQFIAGLSHYERGIYLVHLEVETQRRDQKAAQLAVYYASLNETTDEDIHCRETLVQWGKSRHVSDTSELSR